MPDISVLTAEMTGLFLQAICAGILLVTTGWCLHALLTYQGHSRAIQGIHWPMVLVTIAGFVLANLGLALGFYQDLRAFVDLRDKGGPIAEFSKISSWLNIAKSTSLLLQTLLGDAMLIFRCWVVWSQAFIPILPALVLWMGTCSMAIWIIYLESTLRAKLLITAKELMPAGTTFWALSITHNIVTTSLLIYRIWRVDAVNKRNRTASGLAQRSSLGQVIRYVLESGLLYTVTSIITFTTVVTRSNGSYPISDIEIMIIPIALNLIIIRTSRIADRECKLENHTNLADPVPLQFLKTFEGEDSKFDSGCCRSNTKFCELHSLAVENA